MKRVFSLGLCCVFLFAMAITPSAAAAEEYTSQQSYPEVLDSDYEYEILEMTPIYQTDDPESDAAWRAAIAQIDLLVSNPIGNSNGPPPGVQPYTVNVNGELVPYIDPFDAAASSAVLAVWVTAIRSSYDSDYYNIPTSIQYTHIQGGQWYSGTLNWYYWGVDLANGVRSYYRMYEGWVYYKGDLR